MAEKKIFIVSDEQYYSEKIVNYTYYSGFAIKKKKKSIASLHASILESFPDKKVLEVSTKSPCELGVQLSAFNFKYFHVICHACFNK